MDNAEPASNPLPAYMKEYMDLAKQILPKKKQCTACKTILESPFVRYYDTALEMVMLCEGCVYKACHFYIKSMFSPSEPEPAPHLNTNLSD